MINFEKEKFSGSTETDIKLCDVHNYTFYLNFTFQSYYNGKHYDEIRIKGMNYWNNMKKQ